MPVIKLETIIKAPVKRVFDLARSIDLHKATMSRHNETAVAGVTCGLINFGETITWEATHFGVRQKLTSKITAFDSPNYFRDSMVSGAFARFDHDHFFDETGKGETLMSDTFSYDSPFGIFGKIADRCFLEKYMNRMIEERNRVIKETAEGKDWRKFLKNPT